MATRNTRTALTDSQGNNRTATHLSTHIIVKVGGYIVGAIQNITFEERRDVRFIDEVGTDGHIDSAPRSSANYTGTCERVRFDGARILPAFAQGYLHVGSQRLPFDIEIQDISTDVDSTNAVITTLKNVWVTQVSYQYQANDFIITDRMSFEAETIKSLRKNGPVITSVAASQTGPLLLDQFEQENDTGKFLGSLSAPGLLTAYLTDPITTL